MYQELSEEWILYRIKLNQLDVYQSKDKNFMYYDFVYVMNGGIPILNDDSKVYRMEWIVGQTFTRYWKH